MRSSAIALCIAALTLPTSVQAQSIFDTLKGLKNTVETLTGKSDKHSASSIVHEADDGTIRYNVGSFDVAGIALGMTPMDVREIMKNRGFSINEKSVPERFTFAGLAKSEAERLMQPLPAVPAIAGPEEIFGRDEGRNTLSVGFIQTRAGPRVSHVRLTFDRDTNDIGRLEADLTEAYGRPSRKMLASYGSHWCSVGGMATCDLLPDPHAPKLEYVDSVLVTLTLSNAQAMNSARDSEVAALFQKPGGQRQKALLSGS